MKTTKILSCLPAAAVLALFITACCPAAPVDIYQRSGIDAPGLNGEVRIEVGDIDVGGYAPMTILDADGNTLVQETIVQQGAMVPFSFGGTDYHVEVVSVIHHLFGDDWVTVRVKESG